MSGVGSVRRGMRRAAPFILVVMAVLGIWRLVTTGFDLSVAVAAMIVLSLGISINGTKGLD